MKVSHLLAALLVAVLAGSLCAQVTIYSGTPGFAGSTSHKNVVRDSQGTLWSLALGNDIPSPGDRPLFLHYSTDNGATWAPSGFTFNDAASGLSGTNLTNGCAMAIDSLGVLHAIWGSYSYPSYYKQYYRNYDPATLASCSVVDLSAAIGSSTSTRTAAMDIAVDAADIVWIVGHSSSSWQDRLVKTNAAYDPMNPTVPPTFTAIGGISPSASAQTVSIAVDAAGLIHCSYYRNTGAGIYEHRYWDPAAASWGPATTLGNTTPTNDYYGILSADYYGYVHCVYGMDLGTADLWKFRYKRWDATSGWSSEEFLFDVPTTQYTGVANRYIVAMGCDEGISSTTHGKVWIVYRDLDPSAGGGALRLLERDSSVAIGGPALAWTDHGTISTPDLQQHYYYRPCIRGALYPQFNNTREGLDITYRRGASGSTSYDWRFHRISLIALPSLTLSAPPLVNTLVQVNVSSPADANKVFICGFAAGDTPGLMLPDMRVIPLNIDPLLDYSLLPGNGIFSGNIGTLDGSGGATGQILIPNAPWIIGLSIYGAFVIPDPMAPYGVGTISPGLTVTFQ